MTQLYTLHIFSRKGACLYFKEWSRPINSARSRTPEELAQAPRITPCVVLHHVLACSRHNEGPVQRCAQGLISLARSPASSFPPSPPLAATIRSWRPVPCRLRPRSACCAHSSF